MKEFAKTSEKELVKILGEKRDALHNFRFGVAGSKVRNVKEGRSLRREIARILTALKLRTTVQPK
ncbi:50S ribosomal protein L29 [Candidatus Parcubacteria bacterium]|nr:50S ribosomal protein L29 [Candidatus Parcubacteria bacterium]